MQVSDLAQVMSIEREAFSAPWPASAYRYELTQNDLSWYLVVRKRQTKARLVKWVPWLDRTESAIVAYGGLWSIVDEAHISTLAVHPQWRGRSLGELALVALIDIAILRDAREVTLEVRVSNHVAQNLYKKHRFVEVGRRKRYYHDNNEDALIMTLSDVTSTRFQEAYKLRKRALYEALVEQTGGSRGDGG
jgi:ribosomal-protein-alanine N-acetyltransferase